MHAARRSVRPACVRRQFSNGAALHVWHRASACMRGGSTCLRLEGPRCPQLLLRRLERASRRLAVEDAPYGLILLHVLQRAILACSGCAACKRASLAAALRPGALAL